MLPEQVQKVAPRLLCVEISIPRHLLPVWRRLPWRRLNRAPLGWRLRRRGQGNQHADQGENERDGAKAIWGIESGSYAQ